MKAKMVILKGHMSDFLKFEKMTFGAKIKAKIGQNKGQNSDIKGPYESKQ